MKTYRLKSTGFLALFREVSLRGATVVLPNGSPSNDLQVGDLFVDLSRKYEIDLTPDLVNVSRVGFYGVIPEGYPCRILIKGDGYTWVRFNELLGKIEVPVELLATGQWIPERSYLYTKGDKAIFDSWLHDSRSDRTEFDAILAANSLPELDANCSFMVVDHKVGDEQLGALGKCINHQIKIVNGGK